MVQHRLFWQEVRRLMGSLLLLLGGFYLLLGGYFYVAQEQLLFPGRGISDSRLEAIRQQHGEVEVTLTADDGTPLHGWLVPGREGGRAPLLIYFGGNAEEVSGLLERRAELATWSLLLINYRGFGRSEGQPGEAALFGDAQRIYDWAMAHPELEPSQVVAWGRSLGSGVAIHLAATRKLDGVLLVTPYDSIQAVARHHYPWLPVGLLLRHPFDARSQAATFELPLLTLAAEKDRIIPPGHAVALHQVWPGDQQRLVILPEVGHNNLQYHPDYWQHIHRFLADQL